MSREFLGQFLKLKAGRALRRVTPEAPREAPRAPVRPAAPWSARTAPRPDPVRKARSEAHTDVTGAPSATVRPAVDAVAAARSARAMVSDVLGRWSGAHHAGLELPRADGHVTVDHLALVGDALVVIEVRHGGGGAPADVARQAAAVSDVAGPDVRVVPLVVTVGAVTPVPEGAVALTELSGRLTAVRAAGDPAAEASALRRFLHVVGAAEGAAPAGSAPT